MGDRASHPTSRAENEHIIPGEVTSVGAAGGRADVLALMDCGDMWKMVESPVYEDPVGPGEEYSELSVGYAKRGPKWVRLALVLGIAASNILLRSGRSAEFGYGPHRPISAPPLCASHYEYDVAKAKYILDLTRIIGETACADRRSWR